MQNSSAHHHSRTNLSGEVRCARRLHSIFLRRDVSPFRRLTGSLVLFVALVGMAQAGRYELIKTEIPDEGYQYSDLPGGVCEAYEKNLNSFPDEPYGMACGRKLNPALGFTRPTWEKLDLLKHAVLVQEIELFLKFPPFFSERVDEKRFLVALKEQQAKGLTLELTRLDIDEDGKPDNLIRFGWEGGV